MKPPNDMPAASRLDVAEPQEVLATRFSVPALGRTAQRHRVVNLVFLTRRGVHFGNDLADGIVRFQIDQHLSQLSVDFVIPRGEFAADLGENRLGLRTLDLAESDCDQAVGTQQVDPLPRARDRPS